VQGIYNHPVMPVNYVEATLILLNHVHTIDHGLGHVVGEGKGAFARVKGNGMVVDVVYLHVLGLAVRPTCEEVDLVARVG